MRIVRNRILQNAFAVAAVLVVGGILTVAAAQSEESKASIAADPRAAYCTSTGGTVERRVPYYGTNNARQNWLQLAGAMGFCQYTSTSDGSRIHVSLDTLLAKQPSLAALAYYAQVPWNGQGQGNPASFYCTQLGGSDLFGGVTAAGGAWVEFGSIDEALEACIFPDKSTIDSWGLLYYSAGFVRGADLSTILKYHNPFPARQASK